jgi:hypothetical protein
MGMGNAGIPPLSWESCGMGMKLPKIMGMVLIGMEMPFFAFHSNLC